MAMDVSDIVETMKAEVMALSAGDRLPTMRAYMKRFGVSQLLVSQALLILRQEGLIDSHVGRGTFVSKPRDLRTVLWVCGIDILHGEISHYWTSQLNFGKTKLADRGFSMDIAWISSFRPEDSGPYCSAETLDRYAGFAFAGCHDQHRFMNYVMRNETVPSVRIRTWPVHARQVCSDLPQIYERGFAALKAKGHSEVSLFTVEGEDETRLDLVRRVADRVGVRVRMHPYRLLTWTAEYQDEGFRLMSDLLESGTLAAGIFIADDFVAQGATRALLAKCTPDRLRELDIVVHGAKQSMLNLGLPVLYLTLDVEDMVSHAIDILINQVEGRAGAPDHYCCPVQLAADLGGRSGVKPAPPEKSLR